jgi:hypothetical protein
MAKTIDFNQWGSSDKLGICACRPSDCVTIRRPLLKASGEPERIDFLFIPWILGISFAFGEPSSARQGEK